MIPVRPPVMKVDTIPMENNMPGLSCRFPFQRVVIQLKAFTADGIAISRVVKVKTDPRNGFIPEINIWCPQTMVERKAMARIDALIARYPKIGLRAFTAI